MSPFRNVAWQVAAKFHLSPATIDNEARMHYRYPKDVSALGACRRYTEGLYDSCEADSWGHRYAFVQAYQCPRRGGSFIRSKARCKFVIAMQTLVVSLRIPSISLGVLITVSTKFLISLNIFIAAALRAMTVVVIARRSILIHLYVSLCPYIARVHCHLCWK